MLSVEEASRYAGGYDDPARLVSAFAGVDGSVSSNGISIRGNSPQFLQWRLEGVEVPNPTHFQDITGVGGGILTALSSQVLGNSDFFTGAFPAEYGNALSGVFDMQLRSGNSQSYEHTAQIGTTGIEFASEGPFRKGGRASYLFNYRYSTMGLLNAISPDLLGYAGGMNYQDLSFKMNFPTRKAGTFSVWGVVLYVSIACLEKDGGGPLELHIHEHNHLFIVVKGEAEILLNNEKVIVHENESYLVKVSIPHSVWNNLPETTVIVGLSVK
jgi:hypothetical protein